MSKQTLTAAIEPQRSWFTAQELIGLPGLPGTVQGVNYRARQDGWDWQPRRAQGGGREFAFGSLPAETQSAILVRAVAVPQAADSAEEEIQFLDVRDAKTASRLNET